MILYGGGAPKDGESDGEVFLKKGPWTAAEDETLSAYVREHGEGNWNAVQKKTWLARCGKSCRLRWANHLRPNLRKGSFSADEERLIIQLHSQLGNKWARMAAQLPGRTDNEIKNYWNTRLKRFQRQGLPLYPPDIFPNNQYLQQQPNTPSSSFTFQSPSPRTHNPTLPLIQSPPLRPKRSYNTAFSTKPSYSSSPTTFFASSHTHSSPSSYQFTKQELSSNQIPYTFSDNGNCNQNLNTNLHISTCQLLEDLLEEAEALADNCRDPKRRHLMDDNFFSSSFGHCGSSNDLCSLEGLQPKEEASLQMNTMQVEDIAKLLDWGSESKEISIGQFPVLTTEDSLLFDDHQFALLFPVNDDNNSNTNKNLSLSSCSWDSLPGIC